MTAGLHPAATQSKYKTPAFIGQHMQRQLPVVCISVGISLNIYREKQQEKQTRDLLVVERLKNPLRLRRLFK